jgi:hypothetical protein
MVAFPPPVYPLDPEVYDRAHSPLTLAIHESGHAVVALSFGIAVTGLDLYHCRTRRRDDPISYWMQAVTALSGPASEQKYVGYPRGAVMRLKGSNWAADYANAAHWLSCAARATQITGVSLEQAERMAAHLVGEHWNAIGRVAAALAESGELSGVALDRLWRAEYSA